MLDRTTLWIGNRDRVEFDRIIVRLQLQSQISFQKSVPMSPVGARLIVIAHSRPGEVSLEEIERVQNRNPQIRVVNLFGEWCCGEKRIAPKDCSVPRLYTHELHHVDDVWTCLAGSRGGVGSIRTGKATSTVTPLVVVYGSQASYGQGIVDALAVSTEVKSVQMRLEGQAIVDGVDFVVWEAGPDSGYWDEQLRTIRQRHPHAKIVALLTYPRVFEVEHLQRHDVRVLAQPFALSELFSFFRGENDVVASSAA